MNNVMSKECLTCGGAFPNGCICHAKDKMPVWVELDSHLNVTLKQSREDEAVNALAEWDMICKKIAPKKPSKMIHDEWLIKWMGK